jgi:predicted RNase H-like nuclease (RuvC/YqgF family)
MKRRTSYAQLMNRYTLFAAISLAVALPAFGQQDAARTAAAIADQRAAEERDKLFNSQIQDLQRTVSRQQTDINELRNQNERLARELRDSEARHREAIGNSVTQKQLQNLVDSISKVDKNRLADRDLFIEQLKEIKKIALEKPQIVVAAPPTNIETRPDKNKDKPKDEEIPTPLDNPNGYYAYTVKPGDNLSAIVTAYNKEFKDQGKKLITIDQVKKANPKINPSNIPVGKVLQIPIPSEK